MSYAGNTQAELDKRSLRLFSQTITRCEKCGQIVCFCSPPDEGAEQTATNRNQSLTEKIAIIQILLTDIKNEIKVL